MQVGRVAALILAGLGSVTVVASLEAGGSRVERGTVDEGLDTEQAFRMPGPSGLMAPRLRVLPVGERGPQGCLKLVVPVVVVLFGGQQLVDGLDGGRLTVEAGVSRAKIPPSPSPDRIEHKFVHDSRWVEG